MSFLRKIYVSMMKRCKFLPIHQYVGFYYEYYTGKRYNDENPVEFNEKIQWYKAHYHPKILNQLVDKYAVREYVREKIGGHYLNECLGFYNTPSEIDWDALPEKFVIKGVHGYGFNLIVPDKSKLNKHKAKYLLNKWFRKNQYYRGGLEWAYKDVKPRFIVEKYLDELGRNSITDYKFYCFGGEPKFLEVHLDRKDKHQSSFYDLNFNKLPFRDVPEVNTIKEPLSMPENFEEMKQIARKLADRFPFVRVDMYSINGKIIFGEMTFYPGDGRYNFVPDEYNKIIGDMFELPMLPTGQIEITSY